VRSAVRTRTNKASGKDHSAPQTPYFSGLRFFRRVRVIHLLGSYDLVVLARINELFDCSLENLFINARGAALGQQRHEVSSVGNGESHVGWLVVVLVWFVLI
tara:strand:- start:221 stop:526 length:306 start_codon:yes stop_codon:yes gene_type:complete